MADSVPVMGRKQLELSPEVERALRLARRDQERATERLWRAVDAALKRGEPQAAIARTLGVTRAAINHRAKARNPVSAEDASQRGAAITRHRYEGPRRK